MNLGINLDMFKALTLILLQAGHTNSHNGVTIKEQLGIFLYTCVTRLSLQLVGERFQ
ncbi:hypothetical protein ID866_11918 [Astraeus odoratus]|nr:hypothetical protein ID866_11918 [Astraeus odoratus]